jgi:uncharacterized protein
MNYPWGNTRRINAYSDAIKRTFGARVQKLSIDAGFTCPNRDGSKGTGGCTFCLNDAFNPSYCEPEKPLKQQIEEGIEFHSKRYRRAMQYLAYFQAYSNTYAPLEKLRDSFNEVLAVDGVIGIVVGTRPDCISKEILDYLQELSLKVHVVVEYGIESVNDRTLLRVNRGHTFSDTVKAIVETASRGIRTGGHMIFGLPGETPDDMMKSAAILSGLPLYNLKFHQLQIFKNTVMEKDFKEHPDDFHLFSEDTYLEFMTEYITFLNPAFTIERIAGETPPRFSVLKPWGPRYDQLLTKFEKLMEEKDLWQGKNY